MSYKELVAGTSDVEYQSQAVHDAEHKEVVGGRGGNSKREVHRGKGQGDDQAHNQLSCCPSDLGSSCDYHCHS